MEDLQFDYYDYKIAVQLPGIWWPWKDEMCADLLVDTWAAESWPCEPFFEVSMVIFKTERYYSWLEHYAQTFEQMYLERKTNTFGWP